MGLEVISVYFCRGHKSTLNSWEKKVDLLLYVNTHILGEFGRIQDLFHGSYAVGFVQSSKDGFGLKSYLILRRDRASRLERLTMHSIWISIHQYTRGKERGQFAPRYEVVVAQRQEIVDVAGIVFVNIVIHACGAYKVKGLPD